MTFKQTAEGLARWRMEKALEKHRAAIEKMLKSYQYHTGKGVAHDIRTGQSVSSTR